MMNLLSGRMQFNRISQWFEPTRIARPTRECPTRYLHANAMTLCHAVCRGPQLDVYSLWSAIRFDADSL